MSRMMPSSTSFFFFFLPEDANNTSKNCPKCPCSASSKLQINQPYSNHNSDIAIHRHRKENLLEHGLEHWRTRRRQRRGDKGRGVNGFNSEFPFPFKKLSTAEKLCICFTYFLMVRYFVFILKEMSRFLWIYWSKGSSFRYIYTDLSLYLHI